jgi:hypothetical protein
MVYYFKIKNDLQAKIVNIQLCSFDFESMEEISVDSWDEGAESPVSFVAFAE